MLRSSTMPPMHALRSILALDSIVRRPDDGAMIAVSQERKLLTSIPGPRSRELHARKAAAVSSGVGVALPVYVERGGGGILVDVDGNQLIDFGSGIAVTSVGNAAPRVVEAVQQQVADLTHTCF